MDAFDIDNFDDKKTWELFSSGRTKGVFQLESRLGSSWAKKVSPKNIEELSDLIAIIRPGTLNAELDGKSMAMHYVDRKSGVDETKYLHPALEPILKNTYGIIVYQESAMHIATDIAGFSPEEADSLRKAVGKKDAALMKEIRVKFLSGCENKGIIDNKTAEQIFDWIQESARYSFNKSHSLCYAINSFRSAYSKAHRPLKFYEVYLNNANHKPKKQKEIKQLVMDARRSSIEVYPPKLDNFYSSFTLNEDKDVIYYGYSNVKHVGEGELGKLERLIEDAQKKTGKHISEFSWIDCIFFIGEYVKKNAFISLISVGSFQSKYIKMTRNQQLFEYNTWNKLTDKEKEFIVNNYSDNNWKLTDYIKYMINNNSKINSRRIKPVLDIYQTLEDPPYSLEDDIPWISETEQNLMGVALSCSKSDLLSGDYDIDVSCRDISNGEVKEGSGCIAISINEVKEYKYYKNGEQKIMCFMSGEDYTGELDGFILFSEEFSKYKKLLYIGNTVLLNGEIKKRKEDLSFIVKQVTQI